MALSRKHYEQLARILGVNNASHNLITDISKEVKEEIVEYIKNNGVYFFTANDDDQGYSKNDPRYDIDYCEDRCEGFYLDTEFNKNISFEPLDNYTEFDLGHARMYYKENDTIKQL